MTSPPAALLDCFAVTHPGAETITARELSALGIVPGEMEAGGVAFQADERGLRAANLHLRTASRVLVRIGVFRASAFSELERRGRHLPWERFITPGSGVRFRVTSRKSRLYHQDAVAERLLAIAGRTVPGLTAANAAGSGDESDAADDGPRTDAQLVVVRLVRDRCTMSVDSSGELLHRRGYRLAVAKAPLRETLAAAMLLGVGWDGSVPLVDPFCGSGTIPIEGAMIARRIPPGIGRRFAFERWPGFDAAGWREDLDRARSAIRPEAGVAIVASDRDSGAIEAATANALRAGVSADLSIRQAAMSAVAVPDTPGWIVTNPPYGGRVGDRLGLRDLYAQLGHVARRLPGGWRIALLSAQAELEAQAALAFAPVFTTSNGGIPVRLVRAEP